MRQPTRPVQHDASGGFLTRSSARCHAARGFTLIELCFVISIIAILAGILFPVFARARESARRTTCASNLSQIGVGLNMYAQTYDGHYPKRDNDFRPIVGYTNADILYCPSDATEHVPSERWTASRNAGELLYSSYVYRGGLSNDNRADVPIVGERQAWHGELVNVLYLGGYVRGVPAATYKPPAPIPPKPAPAPPAVAPAVPPPLSGG